MSLIVSIYEKGSTHNIEKRRKNTGENQWSHLTTRNPKELLERPSGEGQESLLKVKQAHLKPKPAQNFSQQTRKRQLPVTLPVPWHGAGQHRTWKASWRFLRTESQLVLEISP